MTARVWMSVSIIVLIVAFAGAGPEALGRQAPEGPTPVAEAGDGDEFGPEMTAFLGFLDSEEAELEHLHEVGEVPESDYKLSANRLAAMRLAALKIARTREEDSRPDLYVLLASELTQVLPDGLETLRGKRAGDVVETSWIFHGKIRRGAVFYVLERVDSFKKARPF